MDDESRKILREFVGEFDVDGTWWCPTCKRYIDGCEVTFSERHDPRTAGGCGAICEIATNRTFTTWPDLGAAKEALVKAGKWVAFIDWINENVTTGYFICSVDDKLNLYPAVFFSFIIDPARFCQLCAYFLKEKP